MSRAEKRFFQGRRIDRDHRCRDRCQFAIGDIQEVLNRDFRVHLQFGLLLRYGAEYGMRSTIDIDIEGFVAFFLADLA